MLGGRALAGLFAGSSVAGGDEPGAEEGLSVGFDPLVPGALRFMLLM